MASLFIYSGWAFAEGRTPGGIGIVPSFQYPGRDKAVSTRLSILYGENSSVYGGDLGLLGNITTKDFEGFAISGLFNATAGKATVVGYQLAGVVNWNSGEMRTVGFQVSSLINYNKGQGFVGGAQVAALANVSPKANIIGFQAGLFNRANKVYGFQVGLINVAEALYGLQIGLVNINSNGPLNFFPGLNIGF